MRIWRGERARQVQINYRDRLSLPGGGLETGRGPGPADHQPPAGLSATAHNVSHSGYYH
jgi:hypothetical protein